MAPKGDKKRGGGGSVTIGRGGFVKGAGGVRIGSLGSNRREALKKWSKMQTKKKRKAQEISSGKVWKKVTNTVDIRLKEIDWESVTLKPVVKDFYVQRKAVDRISQEAVDQFRSRNCITVRGEDVPKPVFAFKDSRFPPEILRTAEEQGYANPTPIQSQGWPVALSGRNLLAVAETGSGKTFAYMGPALVHIKHQPELEEGDGPIVLVLAPTRELAQQIHEVAETFGSPLGIQSICCVGGATKENQVMELKQGVHICIATPGRLLDLLRGEELSLHRCSYLVLDEADRMLDMGFEPQIRQIIKRIRPDRQVLMWSATWPEQLQYLADWLMGDNFVHLNIGSVEMSASHSITQVIKFTTEKLKAQKLGSILRKKAGDKKVLVFVDTKIRCTQLDEILKKNDFTSLALQGNMEQDKRDAVLEQFRKPGNRLILVATDVASRGLDVDDIGIVINFDIPPKIETYIHRIGRTGRSGREGVAYSLFCDSDASVAPALVSVLRESKQKVPAQLAALAGLGRGHDTD